jgi:hypothetical protein
VPLPWALPLLLGLSGGELAGACQYPSVVSFRGFDTKCTGTLVHPEVVVTAAHCLENTTAIRVRFGEEFSPREFIVDSAACSMHPDYLATRSAAHDLGVCRLVSAVADVPITPLAVGCELDRLQPGAEVTMVGFGVTEIGEDFGRKRVAITSVASGVADDGTLAIGSAAIGGCFGDSGGPALMRYPDGVWRTVAVLSTNPACGTGPARYVTVRDHLAWLEAAAGRDLTPCHATDGTFVGGPDCRAFEADPIDVADAWLQGCRGALADPEQDCELRSGSSSGSESSAGSESTAGSESSDAGASATSASCSCRAAPSPALFGVCLLFRVRRRRT